MCEECVALAEQNKKIEAINCFKRLIGANPKNANTWSKYIIALVNFSNFKGAKDVLAQAKNLNLEHFDAEALANKIQQNEIQSTKWTLLDVDTLHELQHLLEIGDDVKLEARCRELLLENSSSPLLFNILASLRGKFGAHQDAIDLYKQAIALKPDYTEALNNLGVAYEGINDFDNACIALHKVIQIDPTYSNAFFNLGNVLKKLGRFSKSYEAYNLAISNNPKHLIAMNNLGGLLLDHGKFREAIVHFKNAIELNPQYYEAHYNLGNAYNKSLRLEDAEIAYKNALALKNDDEKLLNNYGNTLQQLGRVKDATEMYCRALDISPTYADAWNNYGAALKDLGKTDKAILAFETAIKFKPSFSEAYRHLSSAINFKENDKHLDTLLNALDINLVAKNNEYHLHFALAKAYNELDDFSNAFRHLTEGNRQKKKILEYSFSNDIEFFKKLKDNARSITQNNATVKIEHSTPIPIFIVGMPRSGTTLVEQIISCHDKIDAAGELEYASQLVGSISIGEQPLNKASIINIRNNYFSGLKKRGLNASYVVDKMPHNFRFLPSLSIVFPEAKFLHVIRTPSATCWSNFEQCFATNQLGYCYDLDNTIEFFKLYKDLMSNWVSILADRIIEVNYEELVSNSDTQIRKLISNLGVSWNKACLEPHKNRRSVATASQQQVRKKIYRGSAKRWHNYEHLLSPEILANFNDLDSQFAAEATLLNTCK